MSVWLWPDKCTLRGTFANHRFGTREDRSTVAHFLAECSRTYDRKLRAYLCNHPGTYFMAGQSAPRGRETKAMGFLAKVDFYARRQSRSRR